MCKCFVGAHQVILWSLFVILLASSTVSCDLDSLSDKSKPPSVMILQPVRGQAQAVSPVEAYCGRLGDDALQAARE